MNKIGIKFLFVSGIILGAGSMIAFGLGKFKHIFSREKSLV